MTKKYLGEENYYMCTSGYQCIKLPAHYSFHHPEFQPQRQAQHQSALLHRRNLSFHMWKAKTIMVHNVNTCVCRKMQYRSLSSTDPKQPHRRAHLRKR